MASQNIGSSVALASAAAVAAVLYSSGGGAWEQLAQYLSSADKKAVIIIGMCAMFFAQALLLQAYMIFPFYVMEGVERPGFLSRVFFYWVRPLSQKGDLDLEALQGSAPDATHTGAAAAGRPYSLPAFRAELRRCWGGGQLAEGRLYPAIWRMAAPGWIKCNLINLPMRISDLAQPVINRGATDRGLRGLT